MISFFWGAFPITITSGSCIGDDMLISTSELFSFIQSWGSQYSLSFFLYLELDQNVRIFLFSDLIS